MRKLRYLLVILLTLLFSIGVSAQSGNRQISGTVTDNAGEPVVGASIIIPDTTVGTSTDENGRYSLSVPENTRVVEVAFIGYTTETVTLGTASVYDVVLKDDTTFLEEVVVVGYGVQKKVNLTGSVSSVSFDSESVKSRPMFNATQALSGAMPGLQVMQGSGNPYGENFSILVRGTGTLNSSGPLVLVDGMEQGLGNVNPSDIASINVLKDAASCAIYGNRGANGVILITTKNGSEKEGHHEISYDLTLSFDQPSRLSTPFRIWQPIWNSTTNPASTSVELLNILRPQLTSGGPPRPILWAGPSPATTIIWPIRTPTGGLKSIRTS